MIVERIIPQTIEVFDPFDKSLGLLNELEFIQLRINIAEENAPGYYFKNNKLKVGILTNGKLTYEPQGLFEAHSALIAQLKHIQKTKK